MTERVNGASYPGIWVERNTGFLKVTFSADIKALTNANLSGPGGAATLAGTIGDSGFGVNESAISFALRDIETRATVLGVSAYDVASRSIDVLVGHAEGWFALATDGIVQAPPASPTIQLKGAKAVVTTAGGTVGTAGYVPVGGIVTVDSGSYPGITYTITYVSFDGRMPAPLVAPGQLVLGPGATSGAVPPNSPTGTPGYYPAGSYHRD